MSKGTKPEKRAERDARFKEPGTTENANAQVGRMKVLGRGRGDTEEVLRRDWVHDEISLGPPLPPDFCLLSLVLLFLLHLRKMI